MQIVIAHYIWDTTSRNFPLWRFPAGAISGVDIRRIANMGPGSVDGEVGGLGVFVYPDGAKLPANVEANLGDLDTIVSDNIKTLLANKLQLSAGFKGSTVRDLLFELFTNYNSDAVPSLVAPKLTGKVGLYLANTLVKEA